MDREIYIYHKDWNGKCLISDNNIHRENFNVDDNGAITYNNDELTIEWTNWGKEYFININNHSIYIEKKYYKNIKIYILFTKNNINKLFYDIVNNTFINNTLDLSNPINDIILLGDNIIVNKKTYKKYLKNIYLYEPDMNYFFYIETINFNKKIIYILNKSNNTFCEVNNIKNEGTYIIDNNVLHLKWEDGREKKFLSNIYYEDNTLNYENIKIIKPNNFKIESRILFSNITLINNKIYLTSVYYHNNPWDINKIKFIINNNNIIKKDTIEYKNYESCLLIILELEKKSNNVTISIEYEKYTKNIKLKQFILPKNNIYAMTLFKDDYQLLKKYLEYYKNLGVDCFLLYYNGEITDDFINEINIINQSKYQIILIEWNYEYWYKNIKMPKHHHAQTMAINDSLYILKNFCNYILYNDLDEYIKLEYSFNKLIEDNKNIDIFEFKCLFCKMNDKLIKYRNFYFEYDENKIIKGNFWDKFREKNLIKTTNINLMGIHNSIEEYSVKKLEKKYITYFYHYVNFYEKNREELMTQYIS